MDQPWSEIFWMVRGSTEPHRERADRRGVWRRQGAGESDRDAYVHDGGPGQDGHEGHRAADSSGSHS